MYVILQSFLDIRSDSSPHRAAALQHIYFHIVCYSTDLYLHHHATQHRGILAHVQHLRRRFRDYDFDESTSCITEPCGATGSGSPKVDNSWKLSHLLEPFIKTTRQPDSPSAHTRIKYLYLNQVAAPRGKMELVAKLYCQLDNFRTKICC